MADKINEVKFPGNKTVSCENGIVVVGANGSGKTRLGVWLSQHGIVNSKAHRILAQKSLDFPSSSNIFSEEKASRGLSNEYERAKFSPTGRMNDYQALLAYLFSEDGEISRQYKEMMRSSNNHLSPPLSKLDIVKEIWEEILPRRELIIASGSVKVQPKSSADKIYQASQMSDGERVVFYLIGQCLIAPPNGVIIVDEPEMHLHKAIQYMLWNKLERMRNDCVFVYLTHDVDFAASRVGFTKIWLGDYEADDNWSVHELADDFQELPEGLVLELYGSRRKILLIEGNAGSNESRFYQNLFDGFFVKPCGSCENVITYVKTLRNNNELHHEQVYGLIDRDRRTEEEVAELQEQGVFTLTVAEFENLFAVPEMLAIICDPLKLDVKAKLKEAKEFVFSQFNMENDTQMILQLQGEIQWRLSRLDLSGLKNGDPLTKLISEQVNENEIKQNLNAEFQTLLENEDYKGLLRKYNRKTIASRLGELFGLKRKELPGFIVRLSHDSKFQEGLRNAIKPYMPEQFNDLLSEVQVKDKTNVYGQETEYQAI